MKLTNRFRELRRFHLREWMLLLFVGLSAPLLAALPAESRAAEDEFFEKRVRPLLVKRCFACHGGTKARGGLSLAMAAGWRKGGESGPAIIAKNSKDSLILKLASHRAKPLMPPPITAIRGSFVLVVFTIL